MGKEHTHILAREFKIVEDGVRRIAPAGERVTPTEAQLKNMPDVFLDSVGLPVDTPPETHGMREMSNGGIRDLVPTVDDIGTLNEMLSEEEEGRDRAGAKKAISARIEFVTAEAEELRGE